MPAIWFADFDRRVLWTRLSCNVFQASAWAIDLILDHPSAKVVAELSPGRICPVCHRPSQTGNADGICETHRNDRGTMGRLIVYFESEGLLREQGPSHFVNEVERELDLPKLRDLSRRLFNHSEFGPNTWRCLLDWLASEHAKEPKNQGTVEDLKARHRGEHVPSLHYTTTAEVVALLRAAVKAKENGSVARAPAVDPSPTLQSQPSDIGPSPRSTTARFSEIQILDYKRLDGSEGKFIPDSTSLWQLAACPPTHVCRNPSGQWVIWRLSRRDKHVEHEGRVNWMWWQENECLEVDRHQAADLFTRHNQPLPEILQAELANGQPADSSPEPPSIGDDHEASTPEAPSAESRALQVALDMVRKGQTPTVAGVAKAAGVSRQYLHKSKVFMDFINAQRGDKRNLPRGRRDRETGHLEAWQDDDCG